MHLHPMHRPGAVGQAQHGQDLLLHLPLLVPLEASVEEARRGGGGGGGDRRLGLLLVASAARV